MVHNLLVEVAENPYGQPRSGSVTVKSGEVEQTLVITQELRRVTYAELLGEWTLHSTNAAGTASYESTLFFKEKTAGSVYTVSGWPGNCSYDLTFNGGTCGLTLAMGQYAFEYQGWDMILMAYDNVAGRVSWATSIQLAGTWNLDAANPEYTFADNGTWADYVVRTIGQGNFLDDAFQGSVYNARANLRIVKK